MLRVKKEGDVYYIQKRRFGRWYKQLSYYCEDNALDMAKDLFGFNYDKPVQSC